MNVRLFRWPCGGKLVHVKAGAGLIMIEALQHLHALILHTPLFVGWACKPDPGAVWQEKSLDVLRGDGCAAACSIEGPGCIVCAPS